MNIVVWAPLGTSAAPNAIVFFDADLTCGQADDAIDVAKQTNWIFAMKTGRWDLKLSDLPSRPAPVQPRMTMPPLARRNAVVTIHASRCVDHQ